MVGDRKTKCIHCGDPVEVDARSEIVFAVFVVALLGFDAVLLLKQVVSQYITR
jgi:hypothetical protein